MDFLQYLYVILWVVLAVLMFLAGRKQGVFAYMLSGFFVFMAIWYGLDAFSVYNMFDGVMSLAFRGVMIVFLLLLIVAYFLKKKKNNGSDDNEK